MGLDKQQILDNIDICSNKSELISKLNTTRYFLEKYLKLFNITLPYTSISPYKLEHWTKKGFSSEDAQIEINKRRIYNKEYWISKYGSNLGLSEYHKFITKGTKGVSHSKSRKAKTPTTLEYWINRENGNITLAKLNHSKSQSTFSLEKCINKYGKDIGYEKFNERQIKWQSTLNSKSPDELKLMNIKKDATSIEFCHKNFGEDWIAEYIKRNFSKNTELKNIILIAISYDNINDLIKNIKQVSPKYKYLYQLLNNTLIKHLFKLDNNVLDEIHAKMMLNYGISEYKKIKYGTRIEYNGITYKSKGEYEIAKYLTENDIKFIYEKSYPFKGKFKYDFYLNEFNIYIEFAGMMSKLSYKYRLEEKRQLCLNSGLNVIISSNVNTIIEMININIK